MKIVYNQLMSEKTTFKIGGKADVFVEPKDLKELVSLVKYLRNNYIKYYIIGNGSNILVSDKGIRGCVIHIGKNLSKIKVNDTKIEAEPGATLLEVADAAYKNSLTGFEALAGIPGTVGGALYMNAGAYNVEIADIVSSVNAINTDSRVVTLRKDALNFSYRKSAIQEKDFIVTQVVFNLQEGNKKEIQEKMKKYFDLRANKQPLEYPSAGSFFKRPEGAFAALLIQDSNMKGERVGDAEVSEKHAGFIINKGNATAEDVYKLMEKVKSNVKTYFNIILEPEVKFWGKFSNVK